MLTRSVPPTWSDFIFEKASCQERKVLVRPTSRGFGTEWGAEAGAPPPAEPRAAFGCECLRQLLGDSVCPLSAASTKANAGAIGKQCGAG